MKKYFIIGLCLLFSITFASCRTENPGPEVIGPEPEPIITFLGRDSISEGNYRGIAINSSSDDAFAKLEAHRANQKVAYISAVNNYFSDVTDLKNRLEHFKWLVLDEKFDTETGVQVQLESGKIKSITLNNRKVLKQWPENADSKDALQIGDESGTICNKLVALSKQPEFASKFGRIVLTADYTYALYDPAKAAQPWTFIYQEKPGGPEEGVRIYFRDKKVLYITVDRYQRG